MTRSARLLGWLAAGLSALWFAVHTFVGGAEVAGPLRLSDLPDAVRAPAWMVWHMVTGTLALMALLFAWATARASRDVLLAATALAAVFAVAGLVAIPLTGSAIATLPQGFLFVPVAALGFLAARRTPGR